PSALDNSLKMPATSGPSLATSSPKRKRNPAPPTPPSSSPSSNMTSIPSSAIPQDEPPRAGSPRTKVAYHFQGLQLEDGIPKSRVARLDFQTTEHHRTLEQDNELAIRKRVKMLQTPSESSEREIPETPDIRPSKAFKIRIPSSRGIDPIIAEKASQVVLYNDTDPVIFTSGGSSLSKIKSAGSGLTRSYPSINRLSDSKSRSPQKRAGTPPLTSASLSQPFGSTPSLEDAEITAGEITIVDPDQAALTWHDDEITGHNPTDPDDDGTGINGIGFRPTAAEAYARTQKRKQQMEQYRTREAREARAKRSERRRGEMEGQRDKERKVRFEVGSVVST
ncbi:hypothetical protein LSUE1_G010295, partial [Lachnellula suecica]